jgi:hypothetical protein
MLAWHCMLKTTNRHLYGGLAQQEPTDPTGIMCRLRRMANKREDIVYPGQYDNENVSLPHDLSPAFTDRAAELESPRAMDRTTNS